jgi:D-threo-aldose 1-dehydrogenase
MTDTRPSLPGARTWAAIAAALKQAPLGFGGAAVGNLYAAVEDTTALATLDRAYDRSLRYFDTAPFYGLGLSERRIGDALRGHQDLIISTKVGRILCPDRAFVDDGRHGFCSPMPFDFRFDYSYGGIMRSWEASLQRLGLASVDILYIHDFTGETTSEGEAEIWRQLRQGGFRALDELRESGAIAAIGVGLNEISLSMRFLMEVELDVIMLAGRYTLLEQDALDALLPTCDRTATAMVVAGPYNSGILATGTRTRETPFYNYAPAPPEILERVSRLEGACDEYGVSLQTAALQFPVAHPQVVSVVPGMAHAAHVDDAADRMAAEIPSAFWTCLKERGLLRADAPVPGAAAGIAA